MENKEHTLTENELKSFLRSRSLFYPMPCMKETTLIRRAITAALFMK